MLQKTCGNDNRLTFFFFFFFLPGFFLFVFLLNFGWAAQNTLLKHSHWLMEEKRLCRSQSEFGPNLVCTKPVCMNIHRHRHRRRQTHTHRHTHTHTDIYTHTDTQTQAQTHTPCAWRRLAVDWHLKGSWLVCTWLALAGTVLISAWHGGSSYS